MVAERQRLDKLLQFRYSPNDNLDAWESKTPG